MYVEQLLYSFTSDAGHELWQEVTGIAEVGIGAVAAARGAPGGGESNCAKLVSEALAREAGGANRGERL